MYVVPDASADMYLCQLSADSLQSLSRPFRDHRERRCRMQVVEICLV